MSKQEIINKVAQSALITFNLEDYFPTKVNEIDIAQFLDQGLLLREKEYRTALKKMDFEPFNNSVVRIYCSSGAILPAWASILMAARLGNDEIQCFWASTEKEFYSQFYRWKLSHINWDEFYGKPVIIKGCGNSKIPQDAYIHAVGALKGIAKKISYGEACSAVPLK
jgi:hypothetical protein